MVEPTIDELLTKAESKYSLVCAAAKRARELVDGAEPMNTGDAAKPVTSPVTPPPRAISTSLRSNEC